MKAIVDEFTDRNVSRERKRQLRRKRDGICSIGACRSKLFIGETCLQHYIKAFRKADVSRRSVNTKAHREAAAIGLGVFYLDKTHTKQFRWTDKRILRLLKNGGK